MASSSVRLGSEAPYFSRVFFSPESANDLSNFLIRSISARLLGALKGL